MTATRLRELVAGGIATAAIGLLVVGVPVALVTAVGWPLGNWRLAVDGLRYGQVSDDLVLATLTATVWVAWVQLTAALAVEVVAVARGRLAHRSRLLGVMQPVAARLIASALLLSTTLVRPATATEPSAPITSLVAAEPVSLAAVDASAGTSATAEPDAGPQRRAAGRRVYEVRRHDTLWGIAERRLGDGRRWREIHALNIGRRQPDGRTLAADDDAIDVGWRLLMPADDPGDDPLPPDAIMVEPGDTLSALADDHLGDPDDWPELYAANVGRPQPDGRSLGDPDVLLVGWRIDIPDTTTKSADTASDTGEPRATPSRITDLDPDDRRQLHAPAPSRPPTDAGPREQPDRRTEPPQRTDQPAAARNGQRPTERTHPTAPARRGAADQPTDDEDAGSEWWWVLGGAGMLAAGVAATLTRLRSSWLRRRSTGDERTPAPPDSAAQAVALATEATPQARDRAVRAVRAYAAGVVDLDQPAPAIAGVTIDPAGTIALLLLDTAPDRLPDGWTRDPSDPR